MHGVSLALVHFFIYVRLRVESLCHLLPAITCRNRSAVHHLCVIVRFPFTVISLGSFLLLAVRLLTKQQAFLQMWVSCDTTAVCPALQLISVCKKNMALISRKSQKFTMSFL